jgi:hypothetical protein
MGFFWRGGNHIFPKGIVTGLFNPFESNGYLEFCSDNFGEKRGVGGELVILKFFLRYLKREQEFPIFVQMSPLPIL